jgi:hypothetical protein
MRKLAILAAALMPLLGGCVSNSCDVPTITIRWTQQDSAGQGVSCVGAYTPTVHVWLDGIFVAEYACAAGGAVIDVSGLPLGTHLATVEGIGADGWIYDRAEFDVVVGDCGGSAYYPVLGEGQLRIAYALPGNQCTANPSYLWFSLIDDVTGLPIWWADASINAARYDCNDPLTNDILLDVPFGSFTLDWIQEVNASGLAVQQNCVDQQALVNGAGITSLPVTLSAPGAACY